MTTASAKAKGRTLQKLVRDAFRKIAKEHNAGLEPEDIESRGMGQNGTDLIFSPAAKKFFGQLAVECKNCQSLNHVKVFWDHWAKYPEYTSLLISKKNKLEPLVTLRLTDFMALLERGLNAS